MSILTKQDRATGTMLGVHYGDSLGVGVEFLTLPEILEKFPGGVDVCQPYYNLPAGVHSDDTQMTMRVAKGITAVPKIQREINNFSLLDKEVWSQFRQWYDDLKNPHFRRGAGSTCCQAIRAGKMGTLEKPINTSSGCGTIMRTAPVAIAFNERPAIACEIGNRIGAMTHGHPDGWHSAGIYSMLISYILRGEQIEPTINSAMHFLKFICDSTWPKSDTIKILEKALSLPTVSENHGKFIDQNFTDQSTWPGGGWLAHYAFAIALYSYRCAPKDPIKAIKISVNHSGDSDTVGAVCGALVGAIFGPEPFERELKRTNVTLETHDEMVEMAKLLLI